MKLLLLKPSEKVVKVKITNKKDFWYLHKILGIGDILSSKTTRKIDLSKKGDKSKIVKKTLSMTLELKEVKTEGSKLKLKGKIVSCSDKKIPKGKYHSFLVKTGKILKIEKKWENKQIKLLKEASRKSFSAKILACVIDKKNATIAEISSSDPHFIREIQSDLGEASKQIVNLSKEITPEVIIVASPSDLNKELANKIAKKAPNLKEKIKIEKVSSGSNYGIKELIGSGEIKKIAKENKEIKEKSLINKVSKEINRDLAVYGIEKVRKSINMGAIKQLIISENFFDKYRDDSEKIMNKAKKVNSEIHIISSSPHIEKLDNLGGISAILRFKV